MKNESLQKKIVREFSSRGITLATAESCTGGLIAKLLTDIPGSSSVLLGGCVTYTNDVKINLLGVDPAIIERDTEVSHACAKAMARGARERIGACIGVSTTGYAGPTGGTEENPVGTVYIGIATKEGVTTHRLYFPRKSREYVREAAASRVMMEAVRAAMGLGSL
jgi:PncC family amidohydrolase